MIVDHREGRLGKIIDPEQEKIKPEEQEGKKSNIYKPLLFHIHPAKLRVEKQSAMMCLICSRALKNRMAIYASLTKGYRPTIFATILQKY
jgi:hypothetical protein